MRGMVLCFVIIAGCTTTAQSPVTPALMPVAGGNPMPSAGAGTNAAPTAGQAANAAPASGTAVTDAAGRPVSRSLVAQGYQPTNYHGQLFYCRREKLTGSQFTHKVCLTEQEAAIQERLAQDEMMKRNSQGKCVPPLCPNH